jgi:transposase
MGEVSGRGVSDQEDPHHGDLVDRGVPAGARHDLTNDQWAILIDGIRFRTRTGRPWRDVPERYGTWQTIYGLFRSWQRAGIRAGIFTRLQALGAHIGLIDWDVSVDSTINRVHQHAAGARREPTVPVQPPVGEPADHALGRSRGGWTTKVHVAFDQGRKPLTTVLTAGQRTSVLAGPHARRPAQQPADTEAADDDGRGEGGMHLVHEWPCGRLCVYPSGIDCHVGRAGGGSEGQEGEAGRHEAVHHGDSRNAEREGAECDRSGELRRSVGRGSGGAWLPALLLRS